MLRCACSSRILPLARIVMLCTCSPGTEIVRSMSLHIHNTCQEQLLYCRLEWRATVGGQMHWPEGYLHLEMTMALDNSKGVQYYTDRCRSLGKGQLTRVIALVRDKP